MPAQCASTLEVRSRGDLKNKPVALSSTEAEYDPGTAKFVIVILHGCRGGKNNEINLVR